MQLTLDPAAQRDLRTISAYFVEHSSSPTVKDRFLAEFLTVCGLLLNNPGLGILQPDLSQGSEPHAPTRSTPLRHFQKYRVYYRVESDQVSILRILHTARDPKLRLADPS